MATGNPATLMGLSSTIGKLKAGMTDKVVLIESDLSGVEVANLASLFQN